MQQLNSQVAPLSSQVKDSPKTYKSNDLYGPDLLVQREITKLEDSYGLSVIDRGLTLAHIIEDPITALDSSKAVQHLVVLAKANGVNETDPVVLALQETIPYLEKYEGWR